MKRVHPSTRLLAAFLLVLAAGFALGRLSSTTSKDAGSPLAHASSPARSFEHAGATRMQAQGIRAQTVEELSLPGVDAVHEDAKVFSFSIGFAR